MRFLGQQVQRLGEVDSTNAVARRLAESGAPEGTCVVAETQTAGQGRQGRVWHSPPGGLWVSVVLRPRSLGPPEVARLSLTAGVAAVEAIREVTGLVAMSKWPNDVVVSGKKVCGILAEGRWQGETVEFLVIGVGINVAIDLGGLPPEVRASAGALLEPDAPDAFAVRERLLSSLLGKLESHYQLLLSGGFSGILENARLYSDTLGREVVVTGQGAPIRGTAVDLDPDAALIVRAASGDVRVISGEVSVRAARGDSAG